MDEVEKRAQEKDRERASKTLADAVRRALAYSGPWCSICGASIQSYHHINTCAPALKEALAIVEKP